MKIALITGSGGLVGSEAASFFSDKLDAVVGIDNDMRKYFFGPEASTAWNTNRLEATCKNYTHYNVDIRDTNALKSIFQKYNADISLILHAAAQPSHDWAARDPLLDFSINATATTYLLEMTRKFCPEATFIFTSTNKVYGDRPNDLPLQEMDTRWEINNTHKYYKSGIDESMSIDTSMHSIFGASKLAADIMTQEYGKYFGMNTAVFRGGCLTGPRHSGSQLHGFLGYMMRCAIQKNPYHIFGYKGKQVRDNIHSHDLVAMFWNYYNKPYPGAVYNAGGGRFSNCSVLEAIKLCEEITGNKMSTSYSEKNRLGDHIWYISDISAFRKDYPGWDYSYNLRDILMQIFNELKYRT